jgi:hypothetical protein
MGFEAPGEFLVENGRVGRDSRAKITEHYVSVALRSSEFRRLVGLSAILGRRRAGVARSKAAKSAGDQCEADSSGHQ